MISAVLRGLTAFANLLDKIMQAWQRAQDRQAGRDQQKIADLERSRNAEIIRGKTETVVAAADIAERQRMLDRFRRK
ncbi:MAG: hypothetical protein FJX60_17710 [Alphaproteobacteria bacterium]|nr:hypothetical protein [Alphaproteobacteria bacterium]